MKYHRWTDADHTKLKELTEQGFTAPQIAKQTGWSVNSIKTKKVVLGLSQWRRGNDLPTLD